MPSVSGWQVGFTSVRVNVFAPAIGASVLEKGRNGHRGRRFPAGLAARYSLRSRGTLRLLAAIQVRGPAMAALIAPDHWVFEGLDPSSPNFGEYQDGSGGQTVVGNETDKYQPGGSDPCLPRSPQGFSTLADIPGLDALGNEDETTTACTMGIFRKGQGQVFTVGTINWSLGLSQDDGWTPIDQITRNVFDRLG
jgi:hypothetical protein